MYCARTCCVGSMIRAYILRPWLCGQNKCKQEAKSPRHERSSGPQLHDKNVCKAMLQIRDILVRIRILGSVPLTNASGCGSGRPKNIRIRNTGSHSSFFKDSEGSHLTVNIHVFLAIFLDDGRIRSRIRRRIRICD